MSEINVSFSKIKQGADSHTRVSTNINSISAQLANCNRSLKSCISYSSYRRVQSNLNSINQALLRSSRSISDISSALEQVLSKYQKTESEISGNSINIGKHTVNNIKKGSTGNRDKDIKFDWSKIKWDWSDTWKMVGEAGIFGSFASSLGSILTGGVNVDSGIKSSKFLTKGIERIGKSLSKGKASFDWKTLFGFDVGTKTKSFREGWIKEFEKYSMKSGEKVGGKVTTGSKVAVWAKRAGLVFTFAGKAYDNSKEKNSTKRKIAETIGETAVTVFEGAAISAALSTVGAPAVAAGVITVGVTWVGDEICKKLTGGKDIAEFVSDGILDGTKDMFETTKKIGSAAIKSLGKGLKQLQGAVGGWWKHAFA